MIYFNERNYKKKYKKIEVKNNRLFKDKSLYFK